VIKTHCDHDLDVEHGRVRLHVPIATNPDVDFRLNGERVTLGEGECWYLRLSDPHSVANAGDRDRIHLVIDAIVSPWLYERLERAEADSREPEAESRQPEAGSGKPAAVTGPQPAIPAWLPARIRAEGDGGIVEWCEAGGVAFTDPFFESTLRRMKKHGRAAETGVDALIAEAAAHPGLPPAGFIFHCSRCGSTLVSQLARALPGTVVISEAPAIDDVLRSGWPRERRIETLRAVVAALGQTRMPGDRHLVVKFDAWHVFDLPIVQDAFPGVPCVFVYRDPAGVVASQLRMPSQYLLPGALDPSIAGLTTVDDVIAAGREAYSARVLGRMLDAAARLTRDGRLELISYAELPGAAIARVLEWTGRQGCADDRARLADLAAFDAKTPGMPFTTDPARTPSAAARAACASFADAPFADLERLRLTR
jgi:hypothetical protein